MAIYSPADLAKLLNVKEPTVRKYSLLLEEVGYTFKRNASGQRWYEDKDVIALQKLVAFKHNGDMKLKEAAEAVFHWSKGENITDALPVIQSESERDRSAITSDISPVIQELMQLLKDQEQRYLNALEELKSEQVKRDNVLLETINELKQQVQDQQQQLSAPTTEETKVNASELQSQQSEKKKGFLARFFNKK